MQEANEVWKGELQGSNNERVKEIQLLATSADCPFPSIDDASSLRFLAFVDPSLVPLHLAAGPSLQVSSSLPSTRLWLRSTLQQDLEDNSHATVGLLAEVVNNGAGLAPLVRRPRVTELLFFAVRGAGRGSSQQLVTSTADAHVDAGLASNSQQGGETELLIHALPLASELAYSPALFEPTNLTGSDDAQFLTPRDPAAAAAATAVEPGEPKRDRLGDLFDEASQRRKKARRTALNNLVTPPRAVDSPNDVDSASPHAPTLPQSYSGVSAMSRPPTASTSAAAPSAYEDPSVEARNKQLVSRTVMAGMRMYGLQQHRKGGAEATGEGSASPVAEEARARAREEEFKAVYHQVYKGSVFAFRQKFASEVLSLDEVRDVADRLLAIYCSPGGE